MLPASPFRIAKRRGLTPSLRAAKNPMLTVLPARLITYYLHSHLLKI